ncbi:RAMP superfamily CRISPR-associated protein [Cohnella fermenti]|uniref:RAMP superfamily CRISPR-associated protein n=1 Tax=Cohnella fermenti TaxID=2565925 RepID=UPI001454BF20|nr:RAMP superfamily CRISPR-associated protein [Cohnella fermenti]
MTNPIIKRFYLSIEGTLVSPLTAGSGLDEETDNDLVLDAEGRPYLPGSSIAGAFRHYLLASFDHEEEIKALFGTDGGYRSRLYCNHVRFTASEAGSGNAAAISRRDGVKLDRFKTAVDQARYTVQTIDSGTACRIRLEWLVRENDRGREEVEEALICALIDALAEGTLTLGAKANRGYGRLRVESVRLKSFRHIGTGGQESSMAWLDWDWDRFDKQLIWERGHSVLRSNSGRQALERLTIWHELRVKLGVAQTLMIREYIVDSVKEDYGQLLGELDGMRQAVIPGTSWAGAIRRQLTFLLEEILASTELAAEAMRELFGPRSDEEQWGNTLQSLTASRLRVEESIVTGGVSLPTTRTAIDRFTGGVVSGALFTTRPWAGGTTELIIRWRESALPTLAEPSCEAICGLLIWAIRDMENGLLSIGGESGIGRGILSRQGPILLDREPLDGREATCGAEALRWLRESFERRAGE